MPAASGDPGDRRLALTASAVRRIATLLEDEPKDGMMLRVSVAGGGCSGFQYGFAFDDSVNEDDKIFAEGGVKVVVDDCSLDLLAGSAIDWVETLAGASFQVRNPNAASSCSCGSSFSV
ncbi:MAG: iron-sulfur cluster insertion protein ErpA [Alphaproteobacteria bacterium]